MNKNYLLITLILIVITGMSGCSKSSSNIDKYLNTGKIIDSNAKDIMPLIEELPEYQDIDFKYTYKSVYIFESDSFVLLVNYDAEAYGKEKDKLEEEYIFLEQPVVSDFDESKRVMPEHEFIINSYKFMVVAGNDEDNTMFPKSFGMIGTSDEKQSIAYLYFYDFDLDYIGDSMVDFVSNYFDYEF